MEAILAPAPLSPKWKRLLRDPVRAPDSSSCPEKASASKPAQEGFLFLWAVLSCLSGLESCHVMYCSVCLAPEGSWYPLTPQGNFLGGVERVPAVGPGRGDRGHGHKDHLPWPPELPALPWPPEPLATPWPPELPAPPWPPELPAPPWPPNCLFRSGGPRPVFLSVSVLRGLQSAHPPSTMELLRLGTSLSGGGSNVSPLSCVSCVPASCVHIWFVSCRYELICVQLCVCDYVLITLCILVLSVEFDFVWSTCDSPVYLVSLPCPVLPWCVH